ncbi:MAG: DUF2384 domain-containing protein [Bryobacterales bacterium]|nr:DUF2384 domain-containing protein [Bryobacterales bacterium]
MGDPATGIVTERVIELEPAVQPPASSLPDPRPQIPESLVRVIARAVEVLGTSDKALRWLNTPVRSLGDNTPISLVNSAEGITRVEDALGQIEHCVW